MPKKRWEGRVYRGRDANGKQLFEWVGRFDTKRERDEAVAIRKLELKRGGSADLPLCGEYVDRYLAEYERRHKRSSFDTQTQRLVRFKKDFAARSLDIPRREVKDWLAGEGPGDGPVAKDNIPALVTLYNYAIDEDDLPLERNPFRKLSERSKGRAEEPPPTEAEFNRLLQAAASLGVYGRTVKAMLLFSAYTLMRPSEIYPLEWHQIDFEAMRIQKSIRLYRGELDEPKTGPKVIPLTPPARDAIIGLPRDRRYVFVSKTGKRFSQSMLSTYWSNVLSAADLDFDFYHAAKHYGVHYMWTKLNMSNRAIAAQAGWDVSTVDKMLKIYGHADVGALEEVDEAFRNAPKPNFRVISGGQE